MFLPRLIEFLKGGKYVPFEAALNVSKNREYVQTTTQHIPSTTTPSTSSPALDMKHLASYLSTSLKEDVKDIIGEAISSELEKMEKRLEKRMETLLQESTAKVTGQLPPAHSTHGK